MFMHGITMMAFGGKDVNAMPQKISLRPISFAAFLATRKRRVLDTAFPPFSFDEFVSPTSRHICL